MKFSDEVVRRAADLYDQCMCEPPLGVAGKDLSASAMRVVLDTILDELRAAARVMVAQPDVPALGESISLDNAEKLLFTTVPGRLLREGVPFMAIPFTASVAGRVLSLLREEAGPSWTADHCRWADAGMAWAAKKRARAAH